MQIACSLYRLFCLSHAKGSSGNPQVVRRAFLFYQFVFHNDSMPCRRILIYAVWNAIIVPIAGVLYFQHSVLFVVRVMLPIRNFVAFVQHFSHASALTTTILKKKKPRQIIFARASYSIAALYVSVTADSYLRGANPRISLASAGVATSLPNNLASSTTFATI